MGASPTRGAHSIDGERAGESVAAVSPSVAAAVTVATSATVPIPISVPAPLVALIAPSTIAFDVARASIAPVALLGRGLDVAALTHVTPVGAAAIRPVRCLVGPI